MTRYSLGLELPKTRRDEAMQGFVNRAFQQYVQDMHGTAAWEEIRVVAGAPLDGFEAMLPCDAQSTRHLLDAMACHLNLSAEALWEDLGLYLITHPRMEAIRRLLRFGGRDFVEFIWSLADLHDRGRLALASLDLPRVHIQSEMHGDMLRFDLAVTWVMEGGLCLILGALQAMADEYGTLAVIRVDKGRIVVECHDLGYGPGRSFALIGADRLREVAR
ncbi:heme NO-binding domain-containing protein [Rhodobacteraceae bacterium XHP0102]|nr:heme NO-binding domain-containing protein [Rhodobacteraceae bacterium XHP0102]